MGDNYFYLISYFDANTDANTANNSVQLNGTPIVKLEFNGVYANIETYKTPSTPNGDSYLYLYDNTFNELTRNDDSGDNLFSKIIYPLDSGRTYYIAVKGFDANDTLGYALCVYDNADTRPAAPAADGNGAAPDSMEDYNDVHTGSEVLSVGTPTCRNIEAGDTDWFKIIIP
ncbi:hypothetical protein ACFL6D_01155 [Spirochaetota bacterium]